MRSRTAAGVGVLVLVLGIVAAFAVASLDAGSSGALVCDLAPGETLPVGASSVFEIRGTVVPTAVAGEVIVSEVEVTYANDPFGPAFPLRDGTTTQVVLEPTFTG